MKLLALLPVLLLATPALAALESSAVTFENLDTPPFYFHATVAYTVYAPGDPASPAPSATDYTYVYTLTNDAVAPPAGQMNVPADRLVVGVGAGATVSSASATCATADLSVATKVSFAFTAPVMPGATSCPMVLHSTAGPGDVAGTVGFSSFVDDQLLRGPFTLPVASFPCFDVNKVKIEVKRNKAGHDEIELEKGVIAFDPGDTFDPATEIVKLDLNGGTVSLSIPAGAFERKGAKEDFRYKTGSGVVPKVHARINVAKGEWEVKIDKTDAALFENATNLDVMLMIGDVKGQVSVPLTVKKDEAKEQKLEFKRHPKLECVPDLDEDDPDPTKHRSCLSYMEVTYHLGQPDQEVIRRFSDEIGHPETTFITSGGTAVTFHTSCSQPLACGDTDPAGNFTITGLSDATGKMAAKFGVDPSCDATPSAPGEAGAACTVAADCNSGVCSAGVCQ